MSKMRVSGVQNEGSPQLRELKARKARKARKVMKTECAGDVQNVGVDVKSEDKVFSVSLCLCG